MQQIGSKPGAGSAIFRALGAASHRAAKPADQPKPGAEPPENPPAGTKAEDRAARDGKRVFPPGSFVNLRV